MITLEIKKPGKIRWVATKRLYHNLLLPAYIGWHENGQKWREGYWVNGKSHKDPTQGPAHTRWYSDGQKEYDEYWINGKYVK